MLLVSRWTDRNMIEIEKVKPRKHLRILEVLLVHIMTYHLAYLLP